MSSASSASDLTFFTFTLNQVISHAKRHTDNPRRCSGTRRRHTYSLQQQCIACHCGQYMRVHRPLIERASGTEAACSGIAAAQTERRPLALLWTRERAQWWPSQC